MSETIEKVLSNIDQIKITVKSAKLIRSQLPIYQLTYCKLILNGQIFETNKDVRSQKTPEWNNTINFEQKNENEQLKIEIYDQDFEYEEKKELIGFSSINLNEDGSVLEWFDLINNENESIGEILLLIERKGNNFIKKNPQKKNDLIINLEENKIDNNMLIRDELKEIKSKISRKTDNNIKNPIIESKIITEPIKKIPETKKSIKEPINNKEKLFSYFENTFERNNEEFENIENTENEQINQIEQNKQEEIIKSNHSIENKEKINSKTKISNQKIPSEKQIQNKSNETIDSPEIPEIKSKEKISQSEKPIITPNLSSKNLDKPEPIKKSISFEKSIQEKQKTNENIEELIKSKEISQKSIKNEFELDQQKRKSIEHIYEPIKKDPIYEPIKNEPIYEPIIKNNEEFIEIKPQNKKNISREVEEFQEFLKQDIENERKKEIYQEKTESIPENTTDLIFPEKIEKPKKSNLQELKGQFIQSKKKNENINKELENLQKNYKTVVELEKEQQSLINTENNKIAKTLNEYNTKKLNNSKSQNYTNISPPKNNTKPPINIINNTSKQSLESSKSFEKSNNLPKQSFESTKSIDKQHKLIIDQKNENKIENNNIKNVEKIEKNIYNAKPKEKIPSNKTEGLRFNNDFIEHKEKSEKSEKNESKSPEYISPKVSNQINNKIERNLNNYQEINRELLDKIAKLEKEKKVLYDNINMIKEENNEILEENKKLRKEKDDKDKIIDKLRIDNQKISSNLQSIASRKEFDDYSSDHNLVLKLCEIMDTKNSDELIPLAKQYEKRLDVIPRLENILEEISLILERNPIISEKLEIKSFTDVVPAIKILTLEIDDYKKKENEKLKEKESLIKKNYPDSFDQRSKYIEAFHQFEHLNFIDDRLDRIIHFFSYFDINPNDDFLFQLNDLFNKLTQTKSFCRKIKLLFNFDKNMNDEIAINKCLNFLEDITNKEFYNESKHSNTVNKIQEILGVANEKEIFQALEQLLTVHNYSDSH